MMAYRSDQEKVGLVRAVNAQHVVAQTHDFRSRIVEDRASDFYWPFSCLIRARFISIISWYDARPPPFPEP